MSKERNDFVWSVNHGSNIMMIRDISHCDDVDDEGDDYYYDDYDDDDDDENDVCLRTCGTTVSDLAIWHIFHLVYTCSKINLQNNCYF